LAGGNRQTQSGGSCILPETPKIQGEDSGELFDTSRPPSKAEFLKLKLVPSSIDLSPYARKLT